MIRQNHNVTAIYIICKKAAENCIVSNKASRHYYDWNYQFGQSLHFNTMIRLGERLLVKCINGSRNTGEQQ